MENFIYFLLASWGLTHVIVSSKILGGFRDYLQIEYPSIYELVNCYQCTGFWVSFFLSILFGANFDLKFQEANFIIGGFIGSGVCSVISYVVAFFIKSGSR